MVGASARWSREAMVELMTRSTVGRRPSRRIVDGTGVAELGPLEALDIMARC